MIIINKKIKGFAKEEDVMELRDRCLPKFREFEEDMAQYAKDNEDMRLCVRMFDESMCLKLNNHKFTEFQRYIESTYMKEKDLTGHLEYYENRAIRRENEA